MRKLWVTISSWLSPSSSLARVKHSIALVASLGPSVRSARGNWLAKLAEGGGRGARAGARGGGRYNRRGARRHAPDPQAATQREGGPCAPPGAPGRGGSWLAVRPSA